MAYNIRLTSSKMFPIIEQYLSSGKTQSQFSLDSDIKPSVFQYWLKKYRMSQKDLSPTPPKFIKIELENEDLTSINPQGPTAVLRFPNGAELVIPWS